MPAKMRRATTVEAPTKPDLSNVPMTPIMGAMSQVGIAARDTKAALKILETLTLDATEGVWAEGHKVRDILRAQGRPYSDRTHFISTQLKRRDINTGEDWRQRTNAPIENHPVPDYLSDSDLAEVAELAEELVTLLNRVNAKRDEQYPSLHESAMDTIGARQPAKAS